MIPGLLLTTRGQVADDLVLRSVPLGLGAHVVGLGELLLAAGALGADQVHHPNAAPLLPQLPPVSLLFALDPVVGLVGVRPVLPRAVLPVLPLAADHLAPPLWVGIFIILARRIFYRAEKIKGDDLLVI